MNTFKKISGVVISALGLLIPVTVVSTMQFSLFQREAMTPLLLTLAFVVPFVFGTMGISLSKSNDNGLNGVLELIVKGMQNGDSQGANEAQQEVQSHSPNVQVTHRSS